MQVDKTPFPITPWIYSNLRYWYGHIKLKATKGKNMVIGEAKPDLRVKELVRKVEYEKTPDGEETFKVTMIASGHGRQGLSYGPPWAHYLGGYQDRLLGGPLGLPDLRCTAPAGVKHKDYGGEVLG
jgi:hypothetical protein